MLIPFEDYCEKITDKIFMYFNLEHDDRYGEKFKKTIRFIGTKLAPFILHIASFIILYNIFQRVHDSFGMDRLIILFMVIFIMSNRKK